jgi:Reverse transcriptase (RNA-dependent DNA polymerase)
METFSPVVQMDMLCAILALVIEKGLKIQQMDIKGTYLNGTLKETIYMQQPEGCGDGTNRVCRLPKPLYGLKQAGHEWNNELDDKLKVHDYQHLFSDLCAYIQRVDGDLGILTVWVDDSLLFASSDKMMDHMKDTLCSKWEVTDLGEPSKIVGIEVTHSDDTITISQENILRTFSRRRR